MITTGRGFSLKSACVHHSLLWSWARAVAARVVNFAGSADVITGISVGFAELFVCSAFFAHRIAPAIRSLYPKRLHHRIIDVGAAR